MKYIAIICIILFSGCTQKVKDLGWSKFIEAKTMVLADDIVCKEHLGYFTSIQTTHFDSWSRTVSYTGVTIYCKDGLISKHDIEDINNVTSPRVAEILKEMYSK